MIDVEKLQRVLDDSVNSGEECGLQLAVYEHGKLAADLAAGFTGPGRTGRVTPQSLFPIFSCGKAVMATAFHMMQEEFGFDYREKVSAYWPEFTGNQKENIEIQHILTHRTGLHLLPGVPDTSEKLADWDYMCRKMCAAPPKWTPGTLCGYQGITFAWLLGELAYRISGIPFKKYIYDRILAPLEIGDDFFFGTTDEAEKRIVEIDDTAFAGTPSWTSLAYNQRVFRQGFIPSANGISTARAAAKIMNHLYYGNGTRSPLLRSETLDNATILRRSPEDPVKPGEWQKFGLGYVLPAWERCGGDIFGHGGAAGAELLYCKSRNLALCFVKNHTIPEHPAHLIRDRISQVLDLPCRFW